MTDGDDTAQSGKYDQTFFLDLAAKGKDEWNKWRRDPANKNVRVTFAGTDFSEPPWDIINFSGFEFGGEVNFSDCKWRAVAWSEIENDSKAFKPGRANFASAIFGNYCSFEGAILAKYASFEHASFGDIARFECTNFGWWGAFESAFFKGDVEFTGTLKEQSDKKLEERISGMSEKVRVALRKRHEDSWIDSDSRPDNFQNISFAHAHFNGEADFSGRIFNADADFTNTRFYYPPDFDAAINASRIDFTGAQISFVRPGRPHWTFQSRVAIQLRALRKLAENTKNHDLERDLYIEERKAERGVFLRQRFLEWVWNPKRKWALFSHILWIVGRVGRGNFTPSPSRNRA